VLGTQLIRALTTPEIQGLLHQKESRLGAATINGTAEGFVDIERVGFTPRKDDNEGKNLFS
jgi:hypothetical protein